MDETKEVKTEAKTPEVMLREIETNVEKRVEEKIESSLVEKIDAKFRAALADLKPKVEVVGPASELRAVADQIVAIGKDFMAGGSKRSLNLNGSGAYNVLKSFEKVIADKHDIVAKARIEYGAGASTRIPVISTRPARPTRQVEGATGINGDNTAVQGVTEILPYAYYSEIFVSAENIVQGAANIEAVLPELFGESFAYAMHYGMITGDATMIGIFANAALTTDVNCDAAGAPTWKDFVNFAGTLKSKAFNPVIVTSATFIGNLLLSTAASHEGLKMELLTKGSIRGVPVYEDPLAPTTFAGGNVVAVGMDLKNYCFGVAREFQIEPIRAPGTAGVYFQAVGFMNGKPILAANGYQLKGV